MDNIQCSMPKFNWTDWPSFHRTAYQLGTILNIVWGVYVLMNTDIILLRRVVYSVKSIPP
jgi:hypothetical protein